MAFAQQLARNAQQYACQYAAETQRMMAGEVEKHRRDFLQQCEAQSKCGGWKCSARLELNEALRRRRDFRKPELQNGLVGSLADLGFESYTVTLQGTNVQLFAKWTAGAGASCDQGHTTQCSGGTCVTCPICHEHRPAVVLMPCGHVVCRDCHRCRQLRQCPMCREQITSASRGLFMDWTSWWLLVAGAWLWWAGFVEWEDLAWNIAGNGWKWGATVLNLYRYR